MNNLRTMNKGDRLIGMTKYLIRYQKNQPVGNIHDRSTGYIKSYYYADFILQTPELWMFIACGKDGKPLEKPEKFDRWSPGTLNFSAKVYAKCTEYQEALERVLFSGWRKGMHNADDTVLSVYPTDGRTGEDIWFSQHSNIESIIDSRIELTLNKSI